MTATPSPDNLYVGKGAIYFDRFDDDGNPTGEMHMGNCRSLAITFDDDVITSFNWMTKAGGIYKRSIKQRIPNLAIVGEEFYPEIMAILQRGTIDTLAQTGSTVTGETLTTAPLLGRWYATAKRGISVVTVTQGLYDLVLTDDYLIDAVSGRIYLQPDGAANDYDEITVDYTYASQSKTVIHAGTSKSITGAIRFVGDPSEGPAREIKVWKADLTPDGEIGLITDDYGTWSLNAAVITDSANHPTSPYYDEIWL